MRSVRWMVVLLGAALLAGCTQGRRVGVQGTVTYEGEPIPIGSIVFLPEGEGIKSGGRIENGHYQVEPRFGPNPGPHRVEIHWLKPTGQKYKNEFGEVFDKTQEGLPDKYNKNTTLTADVHAGMNTIDFDLPK